MANKTNSKVKIISECFIRPNSEVERSKSIHDLSTNDAFHLSTFYMHRGLLYFKPPSSSSSSSDVGVLVDKLKHSMSIALVDFYPLSGLLKTIKYEDGHVTSVHVDCHVGPGARLIHAAPIEEYDKVTVSDIVSSYQSLSLLIWSFFDMGERLIVNHDGHSRPLLTIQVTDLIDGMFIGFTMNHSLGDGGSLWLFIHALSKIFMGTESNDIDKPIFNVALRDGYHRCGYGPVIKLPYSNPSEFITRRDVDPRLTLRIFHFSAESIAKLKAYATEYNNNSRNNNNVISSFQALSAFVWLSITKARDLPLGLETACCLTANTRTRYDPPLPSNQFGNFVKFASATSTREELTSSDGLGRAAILLNRAVMGLDDNNLRADLEARTKKPTVAQFGVFRRLFRTSPPLIFSGSMRFGTYGPEFGLGKAVATRVGYSAWSDGKIVVDPGCEGGGSVDLQVCLLSETMTALESDDEFMFYIS